MLNLADFPSCKTWGDVIDQIESKDYIAPWTHEDVEEDLQSVRAFDKKMIQLYGTPFQYTEHVLNWMKLLEFDNGENGCKTAFIKTIESFVSMIKFYFELQSDDDTLGSPDMLNAEWKLPKVVMRGEI